MSVKIGSGNKKVGNIGILDVSEKKKVSIAHHKKQITIALVEILENGF